MTEEHYGENEPTPADDVLMTASGPVLMRVGEEPTEIEETGDQ